MKTKIAIISDLHGNLEATQTIIKDIHQRGINKIFCLGDVIAKGVHSNECVELVRKHCFITLSGNTDSFFTDIEAFAPLTGIERKRFIWNYQRLLPDNKDFLATLPQCYEFYMSGQLIRLFHASPTSDYSTTSNLDKPEVKFELFKPSNLTPSQQIADIIIYGHIHYQFMEKLYCRTLINVGSVGNSLDLIRDPKKDSCTNEVTQAHYLIIEGNYQDKKVGEISFQFMSVPYHIERELESLGDNLEAEEYRNELEKGLYREMENIQFR